MMGRMARPLRVEYPGAIYHVTGRMVGSRQDERLRLFRDTKDYVRFLERLGEGVEEFDVRLYLFCLMANHYHLVLETPGGNLSRFMQKLSTAYTVYYNRRHQRHGHLLDGRFKAKLVEGDEYLLKLSRYVHLNPVHVARWKSRSVADRVAYLREYRWSSYRNYMGESSECKFLDTGPLLAEMGGRVKDRAARYGEFVETGLAEDDVEFQEVLKASPLGIGDEAFQEWAWVLHRDLAAKRTQSQDVSFRRMGGWLEPRQVLGIVAEGLDEDLASFNKRRRNSPVRAVAGRFLVRFAGLTQREVAELLGVGSGAAVSAQVKRYHHWLAASPHLRKAVGKIESHLQQARENEREQLNGRNEVKL
jgi:putative transposase